MHWMKRHNELAWRISQGILITFCASATVVIGCVTWMVVSYHVRSATFFTLSAFVNIVIPVSWLSMAICILIGLTGIGMRTPRRRVIVAIVFMASAVGWGMTMLLMYVLSYANLYP